MNRPKIIINDLLLNEVIEREMNDTEFAQWELNKTHLEALETNKTARQTKLNSAITKLKALGLTESEAKIIIGIE
jgi:hypothetical protein